MTTTGTRQRATSSNTEGRPCVLNNFCSRVEYEYDSQGNCISERHKNTDGKLMSVSGVAYYEWEFDQKGNVTAERSMGTNGKLAAGKYEIRYKYDGRDNVTERSYFSSGNRPALCDGGYHKEVMKYNSNNMCVQQEYYGTDGRLKNISGQNLAVIKREYDERGNKTSEVFFTQNGTRGCDNEKVHKYYNQYDRIANKVSHQISFGIDGKPVVANNIAAEGRTVYDKRGNMTKIMCYDGYGKSINGRQDGASADSHTTKPATSPQRHTLTSTVKPLPTRARRYTSIHTHTTGCAC